MSSRKYTDVSLKSAIAELMKSNGLEKRLHDMDVFKCYREVVGDVISKKTREIYLRDKTLVLKMDSGPVKQELSFQKSKIVELINERLGEQYLEQVEVW
jgi:predicted nucleic acid-binding Zn ribbon protein